MKNDNRYMENEYTYANSPFGDRDQPGPPMMAA
jgi:hypothetical protein